MKEHLPHQVQVAVNFLRQLGATVFPPKRSRRIKVTWQIGRWVCSICIPANGHAERLARTACDHIRALFAKNGRAVIA